MEDVLDRYEEEFDPRYPSVCFDEKLVAPEANVRPPEPMELGKPEHVDYAYKRLGTAKLFFFVEPLTGWRHVEMTEQRTKIDYAHCIQWLVDQVYPSAEYIRVQDNLTHTASALYEAFEPAEGRRILLRVEFHYTPKYGSWREYWPRSRSAFLHAIVCRVEWQMCRSCASASRLWRPCNAQHCTISWRFTSN